jgi:hypothetical protein
MKNLYLIPTDKPSRLRYNLSNMLVFTKDLYRDYGKEVNQNIYITSDEVIEKRDWSLESQTGKIFKAGLTVGTDYKDLFKKIILTTDEQLIADGVQDIDEEFLQWFVKNQSCEEVKVKKFSSLAECGYSYHITFPKKLKEAEHNTTPEEVVSAISFNKLINENYKKTLSFGEWLLSHDIVYIDNTTEGNIYDYNGVKLTMSELYHIFLIQNI